MVAVHPARAHSGSDEYALLGDDLHAMSLDPTLLALLQDSIALDRATCSRLRVFIEEAWSILEPATRFRPGWHIDAICDHLEAVRRFEIQRLLITMPPGTSKSLLSSVFFLPWVWGPAGQPGRRSINTSYDSELATRDSVKARRVIESPWYRARWPALPAMAGGAFAMTSDQNVKGRFENSEGGIRISFAVGEGTGEHGNFLFTDDPHSTKKVESEIVRKGVLT